MSKKFLEPLLSPNRDLQRRKTSNLKTREERLLVTEMYLKEAVNLESINQEAELIEPERTINEDKLDEENILSKNIEEPSSTDKSNKVEDKENNTAMKSMFTGLDDQKKWYLSTGKCVDNELYIFRLQCQSDHPSRSLILDPYDKNYMLYNVFTRDELKEIID